MVGTRVLIALGSNLGDRRAALDHAVAALASTPGVEVRAVSAYRETPPVGGPGGQGAFLNAAAVLDTERSPGDLHRRLLDIERQAGRVREIRWGARTLDLDLVLYGDLIRDVADLTIPHPRFAVRRFVLVPMAEVAPETRDPISGLTIMELLLRLDRRPGLVAIDRTFRPREARSLARELAARLGTPPLITGTNRLGPGRTPADSMARLARIAEVCRRLIALRDEVRRQDGLSWLVMDVDLNQVMREHRIAHRRFTNGPVRGWDRTIWAYLDEGRRVGRALGETLSPTFTVMLGRALPNRGIPEVDRGVLVPFVPERADRPSIVTETLAACEACRTPTDPA